MFSLFPLSVKLCADKLVHRIRDASNRRQLLLLVACLGAVGAGVIIWLSVSTGSPRSNVAPKSPDELMRQARRLSLTTAVPQKIIATCRQLAARSHAQGGSWPLYCVPLVPHADSNRIDAAGGLNGYRNVQASVVVSVRSGERDTTHAVGAHWTFAEGDPRAVMGAYLPPVPGRAITRGKLDGRPIRIYLMPPSGMGFYSGHVVIEWQQETMAFQVSLHGHANLRRAKLMAQALMREVALCPLGGSQRHRRSCRLVFFPT